MADFSGWATKHDLLCTDGLTIRKGAFKVKDGTKVPLVFGHKHNDINAIVGHALLYNKPEGIWAEGFFNESSSGKNAKAVMQHGDIDSLSIFAVNVKKDGNCVIHGDLKEVSMVPFGANPGAFVESVAQAGYPMDEYDEEGIFYTGESIVIHSEETMEEPEESEEETREDTIQHADEASGEKTVEGVLSTLNEDQKIAVSYMVKELLKVKGETAQEKEKKEDTKMSHNMFEKSDPSKNVSIGQVLTHAMFLQVFEDGERLGSFRKAVKHHMQEGGCLYKAFGPAGEAELTHAFVPAGTKIPKNGMEVATGTSTYGVNDMSMLIPDPTYISNKPEFLTRDMGWVSKWMSKVHRTPYARLKMMYADITEDEARAKGYIKGNRKTEEVFSLLKRSLSPATIYKKQKFDRDDLVDISNGFDFLAWIKSEMNMMLDEEKARAMLLGDGRPISSQDHVDHTRIIPVVKEASLFNTVIKVTVPKNATDEEIARAVFRTIIKSRKFYKGTGKPTFWTIDDLITDMMLLENKIADKQFKSEAELATNLRVDELVPVEPMEGMEIDVTEENGTTTNKYPLLGIIVNPYDYNIGNDKLGVRSFFDQFDIDFNKQIYLLEERFSGGLIKPFSAVTLVLDKEKSTTTVPTVPTE